MGGGPIFTRGNGNELWVMLIEKAYAKLHGSYKDLENGYNTWALVDLTGCPFDVLAYGDGDPDSNWDDLVEADE